MPTQATPDTADARFRSGTAARLAGLAPTTLRIWEHRYGVVAPPRSPAGQRTYSMDDVRRLRLLKRLTAEGHAIGSVAGLPREVLEDLAAGGGTAPAAARRTVVVGLSLAQKLAGRLRPPPLAVHGDLAEAEADADADGDAAGGARADVLLVRQGSLQADAARRVLALRARLGAHALVVVYAFGTEAAADALRAAGATVCREPVAPHDLVAAVEAATERPAPARAPSPAPAPGERPRRFSDADLVALGDAPTGVACECPRHLAEIVGLLVQFERYSAECGSRDADDAALHEHLRAVTAASRTLLEDALGRVAAQEGLLAGLPSAAAAGAPAPRGAARRRAPPAGG